METDNAWFGARILERFLRYVKIHTTSDSLSMGSPSTSRQLDLARLLTEELRALGIKDVLCDDKGFVMARIPGNARESGPMAPTIGLIAHLDTSEDAPGENVNPIVHEAYDGGIIRLKDDVAIDPIEFPDLLVYKGTTIITSDGTTLLGADDKAGIAEIMTAVEYLLANESLARPELEIVFTPDEETGRGKELFPFDRVRSSTCYTLDGGKEGVIETECFEAYKANIVLTGRAIHLGTARGRLVNAVQMAKSFLTMLPHAETPETTDERQGYYCPLKVAAEIESASITMYIRDFEDAECLRRIETLKQIGRAVQAAYPGGRVSVNVERQYQNMKKFLDLRPEAVSILEEAVRMTGMEPVRKPIRGGTDGSYISERGIPAPNVFTGGANFHSRMEWASLDAMVRATKVAVNLAVLWAEHTANARQPGGAR